jgi:plasmid stabilization system protein ParE
MAPTLIVHWSANAARMLAELSDYLTDLMGQNTADDYLDTLIDFGNDLSSRAELYSFCRNLKLQALDCRCANFKKKYVLIYKIDGLQVNILGVIHSSRDSSAFESVI